MDKKKKENIKTMLLFCLMFIGINYFLYNYVIVPRTSALELKKTEFAQEGRNKDYQEIVKGQEISLLKEIEELKESTKFYDEMLLTGIDTINISHEFYQYLNDHQLSGILLRFSGIEESLQVQEEISEESVITEEQQAEILAGPPVDADSVSEVIISNELTLSNDVSTTGGEITEVEEVEEQKLFHTVMISLETEMDQTQVYDFLKDLDTITEQKIYVDQIDILVSEDTESVVEGQEAVGKGKDYLKVIVNYVAYLKPEVDLSGVTRTFTFYTKQEGVEAVGDLFSSGWEKEIK